MALPPLYKYLNVEGAKQARAAADIAEREDGKPRFVTGALGPTNRTASLSPDVNNPGFRAITFDELRNAYGYLQPETISLSASAPLTTTTIPTISRPTRRCRER